MVEIDSEAGEVRISRKLRLSGDSVVISLPPEILQQIPANDGDTMQVISRGESNDIELAAIPGTPAAGEIRKNRTLRTEGNSVVLSIPPVVLDQAGQSAGDRIDVVAGFESNSIILRDMSLEESTE